MNRTSAQRNLESLALVAHRFEELCEEITFVGGCITGLLITDKAAPDVRFTVDIDCVVNVATRSDYHVLEKKLKQKGFKQTFSHQPICRWDCDGILVDIMPTNKDVLGFSNKWYKEALLNAINISINNSININIISAPYFLATKLEAFKDRGKNDFLLSHDLEDIISLLDGRPEITEDIIDISSNLKQYLSEEFSQLVGNNQFIQALPGHLNSSLELESRKRIVEERMRAIINLGRE